MFLGWVLACQGKYKPIFKCLLIRKGDKKDLPGSLFQIQVKPELTGAANGFLSRLTTVGSWPPKNTDQISSSGIHTRRPCLCSFINEFRCTQEPSTPEATSSMNSVGTVSHSLARVWTAPTLDYQQAYIHYWSEWIKLRYLNMLNLKSRQSITKRFLTVTFKIIFYNSYCFAL